MTSAHTSLTYHIVFATKYRRPTLSKPIRDDLYRYISGIIANNDGRPVEMGGTEDHIHILSTCPARLALADFIRDIKANSSKWLREQNSLSDFGWQTGYGAFTVSRSQIEEVREYIRNQAEHHRVKTFEDEFRAILVRHGITFEERYLFQGEHEG